jgi:hypothetical protein
VIPINTMRQNIKQSLNNKFDVTGLNQIQRLIRMVLFHY